MMRNFFFLFFAQTLCCFGFIVDPWFHTIAEFDLCSSYCYRYYSSVDRCVNRIHHHSHDQLIDLNVGLRFLPNWEAQLEVDFLHTSSYSTWNMHRIGGQVRYLVLDDVAGDVISLTLGGRLFYVPNDVLHDVSSPYHASGNIELGIAVGKEVEKIDQWLYRFYGFLGVGQGSRGYPWMRSLLSAEMHYPSHHKFCLFSEGYMGCGGKDYVDVEYFKGYAKIKHRSVDLGCSYVYSFDIWGSLGVQYSYRIYARAFPKRLHAFKVEYRLPFSPF